MKSGRKSNRIDDEANFRAGGAPHETYYGQFEDPDAYFRDDDLEDYDDMNATFHGVDSRQGYENRYSNRDYNGGRDQQRNQYNYEDDPYQDKSYNPWGDNSDYNYPGWGSRESFQSQQKSRDRNEMYNKNYGWNNGQRPSEKHNQSSSRKTSRSGRTGFGGRNK